MSRADSAARALASVLRRLDVAQENEHEFTAEAEGSSRPRLFGGLVAGQAAVAAARTTPGFELHSLHAYFLLPGDPALPVHYNVTPLKRGKNFHACQVLGRQAERIIFSMQASFQRGGSGFEHADPMPEASPPEELADLSLAYWGGAGPIQLRDCDEGELARAAESGMRRIWMRPWTAPGEDPVLHMALLVFASDMTLVRTGVMQHPEFHGRRWGASLDHALWFHRPPRFDDWVLYAMRSPAAHSGRPLITGSMYSRDGTRIMSSAQEGLFRAQPKEVPP
jgi:acyl-CoA thioesterase II